MSDSGLIPECDWCGCPMYPIGPILTGTARGCGRTWLCTRPACGHELEVIEHRCAPVVPWYTSLTVPRHVDDWTWDYDRSRYHRCTKGHVGQCRGQLGIRARNWRTVDFLQSVGPSSLAKMHVRDRGWSSDCPDPVRQQVVQSHQLWVLQRMTTYPNRCES